MDHGRMRLIQGSTTPKLDQRRLRRHLSGLMFSCAKTLAWLPADSFLSHRKGPQGVPVLLAIGDVQHKLCVACRAERYRSFGCACGPGCGYAKGAVCRLPTSTGMAEYEVALKNLTKNEQHAHTARRSARTRTQPPADAKLHISPVVTASGLSEASQCTRRTSRRSARRRSERRCDRAFRRGRGRCRRSL
jgi:hypothetical protein